MGTTLFWSKSDRVVEIKLSMEEKHITWIIVESLWVFLNTFSIIWFWTDSSHYVKKIVETEADSSCPSHLHTTAYAHAHTHTLPTTPPPLKQGLTIFHIPSSRGPKIELSTHINSHVGPIGEQSKKFLLPYSSSSNNNSALTDWACLSHTRSRKANEHTILSPSYTTTTSFLSSHTQI